MYVILRQKSPKIRLVTNRHFFAVCGLRLSRQKKISHTVSRLDLPTLCDFHTLEIFFVKSFYTRILLLNRLVSQKFS